MKIGYFADGPWSHLALDKIIHDKEMEVAFIVPRFDTQDPVLKKKSEELGIDFLPIKDVNTSESIEKLEKYNADIYVSMSFNQILKSDILSRPNLGFINCHAGALPFYRGRNVLNWVLINDEKEFGVTVHYIDEGIDTGDIILQKKSKILDSDNYGSILDKAILLCSETLHEALNEILSGTVKRVEQNSIHPIGFYCGKRIEGDEWIDWSWSSRKVFNFVRAISEPGPCAHTSHAGSILKIRKAEIIKDAPNYIGTPGEVAGKGKGFLIIKTGDSTIKIFIDASISEDNQDNLKKLRIGDRLISQEFIDLIKK
tara:strand:+ start:170 stop:1108 length:939 start_codon:yes stop_codon:yes gene_type:complete